MKKHLRYLRTVLRHKWYVFLECLKVGLIWQGIIHDWKKFVPAEWGGYVKTFEGSKKGPPRDKSGAYDPLMVSSEFNKAWLHHIHNNPHHWQYWILIGDAKKLHVVDANNDAWEKRVPGFKVLPMPYKYVLEMVCDWKGAGRAYSGASKPKDFYEKNKHKMIFHPDTRKQVEELLGIEAPFHQCNVVGCNKPGVYYHGITDIWLCEDHEVHTPHITVEHRNDWFK